MEGYGGEPFGQLRIGSEPKQRFLLRVSKVCFKCGVLNGTY